MRRLLYHYSFRPGVRISDAELTLRVALLACGGAHGARRVQSSCSYHPDPIQHGLRLRASEPIGPTVAEIFSQLLEHEFGRGAFQLRRRDLGSHAGLTKHARRPRAAA